MGAASGTAFANTVSPMSPPGLRLEGVHDIQAAAELSATLERLTQDPTRDLEVTMAAVTFCDCAGVAPLYRAAHRLHRGGAVLRLRHPSEPVVFLLNRLADAGDPLPGTSGASVTR